MEALKGSLFSNSMTDTTSAKSTFKELEAQCLIEALCFVSSSLVVDGLVLRDRQLLVAANHCST